MSQHFLLTAAARTLSLASVMRMSNEEVERVFIRLRWSDNNGEPYCPHCGCPTVYACRRPGRAPRWRCKACRKDFSVTSGTLFAFHKLPLRAYLLAVAIFCNEVKGKSMLAMSRDLGVQYKTSFVLAHKIREAMASEMRGINVGGEGRKAEIDGGYFGGYVKPANRVENRRDRRLRQYPASVQAHCKRRIQPHEQEPLPNKLAEVDRASGGALFAFSATFKVCRDDRICRQGKGLKSGRERIP